MFPQEMPGEVRKIFL